MYTKLEIQKIFKECYSFEELKEVIEAFQYMFQYNFITKSLFITRIALLKFRELIKKESK